MGSNSFAKCQVGILEIGKKEVGGRKAKLKPELQTKTNNVCRKKGKKLTTCHAHII